MILNYKYRLYVNKHTKELSQLVTTSIYVWNHIIALYRRYYKLYKSNPSCTQIQKHIAKLAKKNPYRDNSGKLIAVRTEGGHRRYKLSDIEKILGENNNRKVYILRAQENRKKRKEKENE